MSIYKRCCGKTKCINFLIKDEKCFDKQMTICEKVCNIINKKINSELIYNKNYLEAVKRFNTKESFQYFYIAVILFDSVYRKDRNYYSKAFLEKFIINLFWRTLRNFYFWDFESSS